MLGHEGRVDVAAIAAVARRILVYVSCWSVLHAAGARTSTKPENTSGRQNMRAIDAMIRMRKRVSITMDSQKAQLTDISRQYLF
jgi:hypothetical protein